MNTDAIPKDWMPEELHPDTKDLICRFIVALADKLYKAQEKHGFGNTFTNRELIPNLKEGLIRHIVKGDPRDVAAYCAFLWHHGEQTEMPAYYPQPVAVVLPEEYLCELYRCAYHSGHHDTVEGNYRDLRYGEHLEHLDAVKEFIADERLNPTATPITAQELAELERDAWRYREIRQCKPNGLEVITTHYGSPERIDTESLDAIMDALSAQEVKP